MAACTIQVEKLEERRFRATCAVFPNIEITAPTEEAARSAFELAIADYLHAQFDDSYTVLDECLIP